MAGYVDNYYHQSALKNRRAIAKAISAIKKEGMTYITPRTVQLKLGFGANPTAVSRTLRFLEKQGVLKHVYGKTFQIVGDADDTMLNSIDRV